MGDYYYPPSRDGLILKKRSEVRPGEIIVGRAPPSTQLARRRDYDRDHNDDAYNRSPQSTQGLAQRPRHEQDYNDGYNSEASIAPRPRRRRQQRARSQDGSQRQRRESSESSTDLGSSTGDESKCKSLKRKKYITLGFTAIALIHAGASIHEAMEMRAYHRKQLAEGGMEPTEAKKEQMKQRWEEAKAIGIGAYGAYSSYETIKELNERREEHHKMEEERKDRHKRREERRRR
ncbi:hypothetical protein LTS18_009840, partial [Coniosporium uncinatum]